MALVSYPASGIINSPLYMVYLNTSYQLYSILCNSTTQGYGETAKDYPNLTDYVFVFGAAPKEKYYPIGFTYHTYNKNQPTILSGTSQAFYTLWLNQPNFSKAYGFPALDTLLTPEELTVIQSDSYIYESISLNQFRMENTFTNVFLRIPTV